MFVGESTFLLLLKTEWVPFGCKVPFAGFFGFLDQKEWPECECEYYDRWKKSTVLGSARQTKCHLLRDFRGQRTPVSNCTTCWEGGPGPSWRGHQEFWGWEEVFKSH